MPVKACPNGKFRIGSGKCIYKNKKDAESAYRGYLASEYAKKHGKKQGHAWDKKGGK